MTVLRKLLLSFALASAAVVGVIAVEPAPVQAQIRPVQLWVTRTSWDANSWQFRGTYPSWYEAELAAMSYRRAGFSIWIG